MRIKKGDTIRVRSGKDHGKTGKVIRILAERDALVVEGVNLLMKHLRPRKQGESGQRVQFPAALPASRVMLVCPKCGKATRVGVVALDDGKRQRACKKCRQTFA